MDFSPILDFLVPRSRISFPPLGRGGGGIGLIYVPSTFDYFWHYAFSIVFAIVYHWNINISWLINRFKTNKNPDENLDLPEMNRQDFRLVFVKSKIHSLAPGLKGLWKNEGLDPGFCFSVNLASWKGYFFGKEYWYQEGPIVLLQAGIIPDWWHHNRVVHKTVDRAKCGADVRKVRAENGQSLPMLCSPFFNQRHFFYTVKEINKLIPV